MKKTPELHTLQSINKTIQEAAADVLTFLDSHGPGIELGIMGGYLNPTGGTPSMPDQEAPGYHPELPTPPTLTDLENNLAVANASGDRTLIRMAELDLRDFKTGKQV